eukprot:gene10261-11966_t
MPSIKSADIDTNTASSIESLITNKYDSLNDSNDEIESPPESPVIAHEDDEREIGMIANILLNISSVGIITTTPLTSSQSVVPSYMDSAPMLIGKLTDSSNIVPFDMSMLTSSGNAMMSAANEEGSMVDIRSSSAGLNSSSNDLGRMSSAAYKKKRQRTSPEQLAILEQIFETDKMPSQQIRIRLANQLGMSSRRVQIWFQNKRAKVKRGVFSNKDDDDSMLADEDEEEDDDDNTLTIDDGSNSMMNFSSTNSSPLSLSSDNIVPSISPLMLSASGQQLQHPKAMTPFSLSSSGSFNPGMQLSQSQGKLNKTSPPTSRVPSPTQSNKKHKSRPSSPTSSSSQQQSYNLSPISFSNNSSTTTSPVSTPSVLGLSGNSLPSISLIKLNSSSSQIPTSPPANTNTNNFKAYNFSYESASNNDSFNATLKDLRFHNVGKI